MVPPLRIFKVMVHPVDDFLCLPTWLLSSIVACKVGENMEKPHPFAKKLLYISAGQISWSVALDDLWVPQLLANNWGVLSSRRNLENLW